MNTMPIRSAIALNCSGDEGRNGQLRRCGALVAALLIHLLVLVWPIQGLSTSASVAPSTLLQVRWIEVPASTSPPEPVSAATPARSETPKQAPRHLPAKRMESARSFAPPRPENLPETVAPESSSQPAPALASTASSTVAPPRFDAAYLNNPAPAYPQVSRELREQGRVVLRVRVSSEGLPVDIQIHASSRCWRLDQAALAAVGAWRFVPARQGDTPVDAWVLVPVSFTLRS